MFLFVGHNYSAMLVHLIFMIDSGLFTMHLDDALQNLTLQSETVWSIILNKRQKVKR